MASKRRLRRKACEGKRRYDTPEAAQAAKYRLRRQTMETRMNVYRCQFCNKYHIGHTPYNVRAEIKLRKFV